MPAPLADGGPIVPCHGTAAGIYFQKLLDSVADDATSHHHPAGGTDHSAAADDHQAHDPADDSTTHAAWEQCPFGVAASPVAIGVEYSLELAEFSDLDSVAFDEALPSSLISSPYRARAPPHLPSRTS